MVVLKSLSWELPLLVSSVQSLSHVQLFVTPWTETHQVSLSITNSHSLLKLMYIELVVPSNHLILHCPLLFLPSIFPSITVFSNESALHIRSPKYWTFSFNISPSNEYWWLISSTTAAAAKSLQSCPILCTTIDGGPPGSPVPGILQARTLEWVTISFSNAWKVKSESEVTQSCPTLRDPMDCSRPGSSARGIFQASTGVGCHCLLNLYNSRTFPSPKGNPLTVILRSLLPPDPGNN